MRVAHINRRARAQRARRDAEAEAEAAPRPGPPIIPAGTVVGHVELCLHGHVTRCELLQIDGRSQTYRLRLDGAVLGRGGAYRAWREVSKRTGRLPGQRSDVWG